ncbi:hypothetical protein FQR65_LT15601 [Abscondita terminalis]|nr:hypothetical protein FQR65_LT15601 [Abscondita terminalis]
MKNGESILVSDSVERGSIATPRAGQYQVSLEDGTRILAELNRFKVSYAISNKVIVFKGKQDTVAGCVPKEYRSQQIKLSGQVVDEDGNPLSGVSITIKGDTRAVVTDLKGNFSIDVKSTDQIVVTFLGMESQTIAVEDQRTIRIVMKSLPDELDEVTEWIRTARKRKVFVIFLSVQIGPKEPHDANKRNYVNIRAGQLAGLSCKA